jgi:hypothetical protein
MNKKIIDDLMKQSYVDVNADNRIFSPEKFAELIVRECARIGQEHYPEDGNFTAGDAIKEHFGVEE